SGATRDRLCGAACPGEPDPARCRRRPDAAPSCGAALEEEDRPRRQALAIASRRTPPAGPRRPRPRLLAPGQAQAGQLDSRARTLSHDEAQRSRRRAAAEQPGFGMSTLTRDTPRSKLKMSSQPLVALSVPRTGREERSLSLNTRF